MLGRSLGRDDDVVGHVLRRKVPTLVRLTGAPPAVPEGEAVVLTAQIRTIVSRAGGPVPTGTVVFCFGNDVLGCGDLGDGARAVLPGVLLPAGVHALTAWYSGDDAHASACSSPLPQVVTMAAAPVVLLVPAPRRTAAGVQLEAELVDPRTGRLADGASGELVFSCETGRVARVALVGGVGRALVAELPAGRLAVHYAGDAEHAAASGDVPGQIA